MVLEEKAAGLSWLGQVFVPEKGLKHHFSGVLSLYHDLQELDQVLQLAILVEMVKRDHWYSILRLQ